MDDDLDRVIGIFHTQQRTGVRFTFSAFLMGMDDQGFIFILAVTKGIGADVVFHPFCVFRIFADYQHEGLDFRFLIVGGIGCQLTFYVFMAGDPIAQHQFIQLFITEIESTDI